MKIFVRAKPNSKVAEVEQIDDTNFIVAVKEPPVRGLANKAIIDILSDYFNCSKNKITIISGITSKLKTIEIVK